PDGAARAFVSVDLSEDVAKDVGDGEQRLSAADVEGELAPEEMKRPDGDDLLRHQVRDQQNDDKDVDQQLEVTKAAEASVFPGQFLNESGGHSGDACVNPRRTRARRPSSAAGRT